MWSLKEREISEPDAETVNVPCPVCKGKGRTFPPTGYRELPNFDYRCMTCKATGILQTETWVHNPQDLDINKIRVLFKKRCCRSKRVNVVQHGPYARHVTEQGAIVVDVLECSLCGTIIEQSAPGVI